MRKLRAKIIRNAKLKAYTLNELLVVLIIIGILVLLALPSLLPLITKARSSEAKLQLEHLYTLEETFFMENSKYANEIMELGFEQQRLVKDGGNANYKLEIVKATNNSFTARATSITDFDQDGTFNVWEINQEKELKEVVKD
jgi:type IV pilus assembly protein PilE